ncbi:MAG: hypothetical protein QOK43_1664 [Acidimicrobiaceae bacterium]|jgi:hypothetical protein|nr:hypothetical protein [Acidimicrobiaceae bacterium]MDQ1445728.1 hypothetical protein [Acidimicrobiaceae bacterium]
MRPVDHDALEQELRRIPGINAVRVVMADGGEPVEIHVLAGAGKAPKQVVRDVQTVAKAVFDVDLDRRIISVVQMDGTLVLAEETNRITVEGIAKSRVGHRTTAEVTLRRGMELASGVAEGAAASTTTLPLVVRAALAALSKLEPSADHLELENVAHQRVGDRSFVVVSLVLLTPPYEELLLGAAAIRVAGEEDAAARAVLDATNRRLTLVD